MSQQLHDRISPLNQDNLERIDDIVIAVVGLTGSGRTHVINSLFPKEELENRKKMRDVETLIPCEQEIQPRRIVRTGSRDIVLLDTPGFDESTIPIQDLIFTIANWLIERYKRQIELAGIICTHRITDNRVAGSQYKNLHKFAELCGKAGGSGIVLVTTMWDYLNLEAIGGIREYDLQNKFWKNLLAAGGAMVRFDDARDSTQVILNPILCRLSARMRSLCDQLSVAKIETLRNASDLECDDFVVAVMGPTGTGKSNFIDTLTNQKGRRAHSGMESETNKIQATRISLAGKGIVLVDTPGFDDTRKSDIEILQMIGEWLAKVYKNQVKLRGILYMHRIVDNRFSGSPQKNLVMFGKLCGDKAAQNVILVTTMWDKILWDKGETREVELKSKFWTAMLDHGSFTARFDNTVESGMHILNHLLIPKEDPETLLLQEELVDLKKHLNETEAGVEIYKSLRRLLSERKETARSIIKEATSTSDAVCARKLREQARQIDDELQRNFRLIEGMKIPLGRRFRGFFRRKPRSRAILA